MREQVSDYPRVLVAMHEPFNNVLGGGITVTSLFKGWPKDRIASVYWDGIDPDSTVCEHHLELGGEEITWRKPFNKLLKRSAQHVPRSKSRSEISDSSRTASGGLTLALKRLKKLALPKGGFEMLQQAVLTERLKQWAQTFCPEIIYCSPTNLMSIRLVTMLADMTGARIALHVYDDWSSVVARRSYISAIYARLVLPEYSRLVARASLRMGIGTAMSAEYARRYSVPFLSFQNCPEPEVWLKTGKTDWKAGNPFTFRFLGTLYAGGNLEIMLSFLQALETVRQQGIPVKLEFYTPDSAIRQAKELLGAFPCVSFHQVPLETAGMAALYGSADALMMAYNFDPIGQDLFRYSMPTKLPSYLLSGTPLFLYAPDSFAVTDYVRRAQCGYVIGQESSVTELAERIMLFIKEEESRRIMGEKARQTALHELSAEVVRPRFREAMYAATK